MKNLYLIRGLPGSGKSTLAQHLSPVANFAADDYYIDKYGFYNWNPAEIKQAHAWCKEKADKLMGWDISSISIHNTFTQSWEMKPYYDLAEKHGYTVFAIVVENRHNGKNIHNVPEETIEKMRNRFEIKL